MPPRAMDPEGGGPGGRPDPEPGLLAGLSPAGLIDVDRLGPADGLDDLGHRVGQDLAGLTLELGDHAGGDRDAQQVGEEALDLALAQAIGPAQQAGPGLQSRPEGPAWDVAGELGPGGGPAPRAGQAVEAVLDDLGADLGEFGDLMADGLGVVAVEGVAAAGAGLGLDLDGAGQLLGGDQLARMTLVAGLATPPLPGGRPGRLPLDVERLGGGRLGGVRGVLVEPGFEGGDPLLEGLDQGEDGRLGIGRDLGPEVIRQWRLGTHAIWCNRPRPRAQAPTGRERLRRSMAATSAPNPRSGREGSRGHGRVRSACRPRLRCCGPQLSCPGRPLSDVRIACHSPSGETPA